MEEGREKEAVRSGSTKKRKKEVQIERVKVEKGGGRRKRRGGVF